MIYFILHLLFLKVVCFIFCTYICHLGRAIKSADWSWKAEKLYNLRIETASIYPDYCPLVQLIAEFKELDSIYPYNTYYLKAVLL